MATRREIFLQLVAVASECYPEVEARQIAEMILLAKGDITRNDLLIEPNMELEIADLDAIFEELRSWRPVQYIVGKAEFADMELAVREGAKAVTLGKRILRTETAGLTMLSILMYKSAILYCNSENFSSSTSNKRRK